MSPSVWESLRHLPFFGWVALVSVVLLAGLVVFRAVSRHWFTFWVAVLLLAGSLVVAIPHMALEARLTHAARSFNDDGRVWIDCAGMWTGAVDVWEGRAFPDSGFAQLKTGSCSALKSWLSRPVESPASFDERVALVVFVHEVVHLQGVLDEAVTTCMSVQLVGDMVALLRPDRAQVDGVVGSWFLSSVYDRMPSEYRSTDCVDGGSMDLSVGDGVWP